MVFEISEFTLADYADVIKLWRSTAGIGLSSADTRERIGAYLERNPGFSFVARQEGLLAGAVLCGHDGRRGLLHHLAVYPQYRNQGIGVKLVERCLESLHRGGIEKCHLFVFKDNLAAQEFWHKRGWKERIDLVLMSRDVS